LGITIAGGAAGVVFSRDGDEGLLVGLALVAATLGLLWLDQHLSIDQIGRCGLVGDLAARDARFALVAVGNSGVPTGLLLVALIVVFASQKAGLK
jgi:hypothetical protein